MVVEDWEHADWQCEVLVEVEVTDINDNAPSFSQDHHTATLPEDAPVNTVLTKMHATDPDLGMFMPHGFHVLSPVTSYLILS